MARWPYFGHCKRFLSHFLGTARQYHTSNEQIDVRISYKASPRDIVLRCDWCEDKRTILSLSFLVSARQHILPWQYKSTQFNHMFLSILCLETRNDIFLVFNAQTIILFPILYFPGENAASRRSTLSFQTSDQLSLRAWGSICCYLSRPLFPTQSRSTDDPLRPLLDNATSQWTEWDAQ